MRDATSESYNRDPFLSFNEEKKYNFEVTYVCVVVNVKNAANLGFGDTAVMTFIIIRQEASVRCL